MRALLRLFFVCGVICVVGPTVSRAQEEPASVDAVALFTSGATGSAVSEAFVGLVPLPDERRVHGFDAPQLRAAESDEALGYVVSIATDLDLVQVLRRSDGARFERRFEADAEDAYAMALVAAELLEVARSGGDPATLGLVATASVAGESSADAVGQGEGEGQEPPDQEQPEQAATETEVSEAPSAEVSTTGSTWAFTVGVHAELWVTPSQSSIWILQPGLFAEALVHAGALLVGGGAFASGFGAYEGESDDAAATYRRYDVGARATIGFDARPSTRLLFHLRGGGSVVTADGRTTSLVTQRTETRSVGAGFVGLAVEARQKLLSGLCLHVAIGADLLPAPVQVLAFDELVASEGSLRLALQLGFSWVIE